MKIYKYDLVIYMYAFKCNLFEFKQKTEVRNWMNNGIISLGVIQLLIILLMK
jgi:hypothetical protein